MGGYTIIKQHFTYTVHAVFIAPNPKFRLHRKRPWDHWDQLIVLADYL